MTNCLYRSRAVALLLLFTFGAWTLSAQQAFVRIGDGLQQEMREGQVGPFEVFILMADQVDVLTLGASYEAERLPATARTQDLIPKLQQMAEATQGPILQLLAQQADVVPASTVPMWITNVIYARVGIAALERLDEEASIAWIELVPKEEIAGATMMPASPFDLMGAEGHEASLDVIKADKLWAMGYTGNGRKALIIDTGTEPSHPALVRSFVGNYEPIGNAWFGIGEKAYDCDNHGTHVAGTILGLDRITRDTIGVAPNGLWMASPAISCENGPGSTQALQWAIDPDGNPATVSDMPDVINNSWRFPPGSWGCSYPGQLAINALEAVGVAVICAAGNDYPDFTVGGPAFANYSLVNSFAVGAINPNTVNYPIAYFSSHGPSLCGGTGSLEIKPEVVAPGMAIRSAVRGGTYAVLQGTSMASPHVAGAVLLLKEAFPQASGTDIKLALYFSAIDLGDVGEDNVYGMGLIDVEAAYYYLINQGFSPATVSRERDGAITLMEQNPCGLTHRTEVKIENLGTAAIESLRLLRSYSDGVTDTIEWTTNLLPGKSEMIDLPERVLPMEGRYQIRVEILAVNQGEDPYRIDNWDEKEFSALMPLTVVQRPLNVCIGAEGILEASTAEGDTQAVIRWYEQPQGGKLLGEGNSIATGVLTSSKLYHVGAGRVYTLGAEPKISAGGFFDQSTTDGAIFDVYFPCHLRGVTVLANSPGTRIIQIRNDRGIVIYTHQVQLITGMNRVELDANLSPGTGYTLGLGFSKGDLWIQTMPSQEIGVPAVLSLRSPQDGRLPYFFEWEVMYELPCERKPVFVTVSAGNFSPSFTTQESAPGLVSFVPSPANALSYRWDFGDGTVSDLTSPTHQYTAPGNYQVALQVVGAAYCSALYQAELTTDASTNLDRKVAWAGLSLFPNPAESRLTIEWVGDGDVSAQLFDATGRAMSPERALTRQFPRHTWNLEEIPAGIFWVRVAQEGRVLMEKVVKIP